MPTPKHPTHRKHVRPKRLTAKPRPTLNLKDPDIQRRHHGLHIDTFLPIATKAGYIVEVIYMGGGIYTMRRRAANEVSVLVDEGNVVREIKG